MGVVKNIFAGRSPAGLALDFGAETITLLARDADALQGWSPVGAAMVADEDFGDQIGAVHTLAAQHSEACEVDLWLPADQVLNTHLELPSAGLWGSREAAKSALGDRTGLAPDEINLDLAKAPGEVWAICAAEKKVVAEAQDYARRWGFAPNRVTTRHADAAFVIPPDLTGEINRKPLLVGIGGAVAAASIALTALLWPSAEVPPSAEGPERIAMAPAAALPPPPVADAKVVTSTTGVQDVVAMTQPTAPEPDYQKDAALETKEYDFAASILSPSPQFANLLSVDFSLPRAEIITPIYANVAYRAPSLDHSPPSVEGLEQLLPGEAPATGPSVLPSLSLGNGLVNPAARPSELGAFDVAALGPAPRALRTEDLILQDEAVETPEPPESAEEDTAPVEETPPAAEATPEEAATSEAESEPSAAPKQVIQNATDPREAAPQPEVAEVEEAPGPGSVVAAPRPGKRPDSLDMSPGPGAVAAAPTALARPKSIAPKPMAVARNTSSAKTVRAPARSKPTGRGVANAATLSGAIQLDQTSLLGVFGTSKNRRALLRMSDGRMKRVSQGEVIDGWVVSRIQATSMRMTRGAEVRNLNLIR